MTPESMSYAAFLRSLPPVVAAALPDGPVLKPHQPFGGILQFQTGDRRLHYEVARFKRMRQFELGLHFESRDKQLNRFLLDGFQRHLIEIRHQLGDTVVVEPWDRGWSKLYTLVPQQPLTVKYQQQIATRLAELIVCCHPILSELVAAYRGAQRKRGGRRVR